MTFDDSSSEALGRFADRLAAGDAADRPDESADLLARIELAARALHEAVELEPEDIEAVLVGTERRPIPPPELPDDYEVLGEVGRGGMGVVYRAKQRSLDRMVAVKVLRPGDLLFGQAMQRFLREAKALARLRHRHIVSIHEVGEAEGQVWFSMDYIDGESLDQVIKQGDLTPSRAVKLMKQVASAVAYVHTHGLVHRDLKPANILVDVHGDAVVTDFGLALEIGSADGLTMTGQILGTPAYMSPEQARGDSDAIGEATDVYALGAVLYECLTGRRLFQGESPPMQIYSVLRREPTPPRKLDKRIPESLELICLKALRKRPADRYPTARALLDDLERFEEGRAVRAEAPSKSYRLGRWLRRHRAPIAWATTALVAASLVFAFVVAPRLRSDPDELMRIADERMQVLGDAEGAARLYETAFHLLQDIPSEEAYAKLTEYRLQAARAQWDTPRRAAETIPGLEVLLAEGRDLYAGGGWRSADARSDRQGWPDEGRVHWALGTAYAVAGQAAKAAFGFEHGLMHWNAAVRGRPAGTAPARILESILPAVTNEADPLHLAATLQLEALAERDALGFPHPGSPLLDEGDLDPARLIVPFLRALAKPPETRARIHRFAGIRRLACRCASPALEQELVRALEAGGDPQALRGLGATLADLTDLPSRFAFAALDPERIPDEVERLLDMVHDTHDLTGRAAAWQRLEQAVRTWEGIEAELAAAAGQPPREWPQRFPVHAQLYLRDWFVKRTGADPMALQCARDARYFLERHAGEEPLDWLVAALGLSARPAAEEAGALLLRLTSPSSAVEQAHLHFVLASLLPPETQAPVWGTRYVRSDLVPIWRDLLQLTPAYQRARLARIVLGRGGWRIDGEDSVKAVGDDGTLRLHLEGERDALRVVSGAITAPGLPLQVGPAARQALKVEAELGTGHRLENVRIQYQVRRQGGSSSRSSFGSSAFDARFVYSPDLRVWSWSDPDPFRNELTLVVLEQEDGAALSGGLDAWSARRVADLQTVVARAEELGREDENHDGLSTPKRLSYLLSLQTTLLNQVGLATQVPLAEGVESMRRLEDQILGSNRVGRAMRNGRPDAPTYLDEQFRMLLLARLLAGDEGALDEPNFAARLDGVEPHRTAMTTAGRDGEYWIRLARLTDSERIRDLALESLEAGSISGRAAGDLLDAIRWGQIEPTPGLRVRLDEGPTQDRSFWGLLRSTPWLSIPAALVLLFGVLGTLRVLWPGLRRDQRLLAAGWLVFLGLITACVSYLIAGFDVLPDMLGYAWAALGVWVLGRESTDPYRRTRTWLFALCAALSVRMLLGAGSEVERLLVGALCFLAFATLPVLGRHLRGLKTGRRIPWAFAVFYVLPLGLLYVVAVILILYGSATDSSTHVVLDSPLTYPFLIALPVAVLWAILSLIQSAAVRKAWLRSRRVKTV